MLSIQLLKNFLWLAHKLLASSNCFWDIGLIERNWRFRLIKTSHTTHIPTTLIKTTLIEASLIKASLVEATLIIPSLIAIETLITIEALIAVESLISDVIPSTFLSDIVPSLDILKSYWVSLSIWAVCGFTFREGEIWPHHIMRLDNNIDDWGCIIPSFNWVEFFVQDEGLGISGRSEWFIEIINSVFLFMVDNSDIGWFSGKSTGYHHVVINFAGFAPHINI